MAASAPVVRKRQPVRLLPDRRAEGRTLARRLELVLHREDNAAALASLPAALAGDATAACNLIAAVQAELRGFVAVTLHLHDVPAHVMRETLATIAFRDHAHLYAAAPAERIAAMCRHAEAEAPAELPETFTVWRGVRGQGIKRGSKGLTWTLNRAAACWDATHDNSGGMYPMVLTATARRQDVGLRIGDDLLLYRVEGARGDREENGLDGWRATGVGYRNNADPAALAQRRGAHPPRLAGMPITVESHVQAIGAVLVSEMAADAIGTLFNAYSELPEGERAAFALALVAELVVGRAAIVTEKWGADTSRKGM